MQKYIIEINLITEMGTGEELEKMFHCILEDSIRTHRREWENFGKVSTGACKCVIAQPVYSLDGNKKHENLRDEEMKNA